MARVARSSLPDGFFHVFARGAPGAPPFPDPDDRTAMLGLILKTQRRIQVVVHVATVMSTHYHALFEAKQVDLSHAVQWLQSRYARAFNRRHDRFGSVFAERYSARALETEDDVGRATEYILNNPVEAGLCERPEDWPWSYSRYGFG
jgi:putative transposase